VDHHRALLGVVGVYGAALAVGAISSLVPLISIEVFLVAITVVAELGDLMLVVDLPATQNVATAAYRAASERLQKVSNLCALAKPAA